MMKLATMVTLLNWGINSDGNYYALVLILSSDPDIIYIESGDITVLKAELKRYGLALQDEKRFDTI